MLLIAINFDLLNSQAIEILVTLFKPIQFFYLTQILAHKNMAMKRDTRLVIIFVTWLYFPGSRLYRKESLVIFYITTEYCFRHFSCV
jgi:hypothetical protein